MCRLLARPPSLTAPELISQLDKISGQAPFAGEIKRSSKGFYHLLDLARQIDERVDGIVSLVIQA